MISGIFLHFSLVLSRETGRDGKGTGIPCGRGAGKGRESISNSPIPDIYFIYQTSFFSQSLYTQFSTFQAAKVISCSSSSIDFQSQIRSDSRRRLGGIQLGRPQKIALFGPPPPLCTHFRPQGPDPLPFSTSARPDPPPQKKNPPKCMDATVMQFPSFGW